MNGVHVRQTHVDFLLEPTENRRVELPRVIGGGHHNHIGQIRESVHHLQEGVGGTGGGPGRIVGVSASGQRIDFVNEYHAHCRGMGLFRSCVGELLHTTEIRGDFTLGPTDEFVFESVCGRCKIQHIEFGCALAQTVCGGLGEHRFACTRWTIKQKTLPHREQKRLFERLYNAVEDVLFDGVVTDDRGQSHGRMAGVERNDRIAIEGSGSGRPIAHFPITFSTFPTFSIFPTFSTFPTFSIFFILLRITLRTITLRQTPVVIRFLGLDLFVQLFQNRQGLGVLGINGLGQCFGRGETAGRCRKGVECVREMLQGHPSFQIGGQCVFQVAGVLVAFGLGQEVFGVGGEGWDVGGEG